MASDVEEYDVIIEGTGLYESLLATSCALNGKKVLQIEPQNSYGGPWQAFTSLTSLIDWTKTCSTFPFDNFDFEFGINYSPGDRQQCSIELSPYKVIPSSSKIINLVANSSMKEYMTLSSVTRNKFGIINDSHCIEWKAIPMSKSEVFKSKNLSLLQKRQLMRVTEHALSFDLTKVPDKGHRSFDEALRDSPFELDLITSLAISYALINNVCPIGETSGWSNLKSLMSSYGLYGPFCWITCAHGCLSELIQATCRLGAVNGATYMLNTSIIRNYPSSESETDTIVEYSYGGDNLKAKCKNYIGCRNNVNIEKDSKEIWANLIVMMAGTATELFDQVLDSDSAGFITLLLKKEAKSDTLQTDDRFVRIYITSDPRSCVDGKSAWYISATKQDKEDLSSVFSDLFTVKDILERETRSELIWLVRYTYQAGLPLASNACDFINDFDLVLDEAISDCIKICEGEDLNILKIIS